MPTINIIGAGIGGLAAALALWRRGCQVSLFERTSRPAPVGAGIVLAPNALHSLACLGVDLTPCGYPIRRFTVRDGRGRPLQTMDLLEDNRSVGTAPIKDF
jgi:2-polyprenyl-6-methoxyphenol hydroxylase-like FAD-dependent oxidoreductase